MKLYFCRFPYQKDWKLHLSTDTSFPFLALLEIYSVRLTFEVLFREVNQYLKFGNPQYFDAQITITTYILYMFLPYFRRVNDYETLGGLFEHVKAEMIEKKLAERLWDMFEELLQVVITAGSRLWNGRHQRVQKLPRISISKGSYLKTHF